MTSGPTIDYEALHQEAMRGVVKSVLTETARSGLPGDHHFYISFNTRAPGVILSRRLKEKYPYEMTIVLQHRFWGLVVSEERFEVNLTFDGIPERLVVPFQAIRVFVDPSVRYGLQFETADIGPDPAPAASSEKGALIEKAENEGRDGEKASAPRKSRATKKTKSATERGATNTAGAERAASKRDAEPAPPPANPEPTPQVAGGPANVVSLDQFRKR